MNLLESNYPYKINYLCHIRYQDNNDLEDDQHIDILATSHGKLYKISYHENWDENSLNITEITKENKSEILDEYMFLKHKWINYSLLTPDSMYIENDRRDYHKMHFDIVSEDGKRGLMFFKQKMIPLSFTDICDIIEEDALKMTQKDLIDYYTKQNEDLEKYFREDR